LENINEQAVLLGDRRSLVGILTRAAGAESGQNPAVIILNTGIVHRVGHNRMFVTLSRVLAGAGLTVLRFDFSGIGDSELRTDGLPPLESCLAEITEAVDWLERERRISRVVLIGLCSGADHAILYGHTDPRVMAVALLDPTIPATTRYYFHYITRRLTRLSSWVSVLAGRSGIFRALKGHMFPASRRRRTARPATLQDLRHHNYLEQCYRETVDRGIQILGVFTEDTTRQTYREQIIDAFPNISFGNLLKLEFFRGTDHTFTSTKDRARLIDVIVDWLKSSNYRGSPVESSKVDTR
jgi:hypothetical protein